MKIGLVIIVIVIALLLLVTYLLKPRKSREGDVLIDRTPPE